MIDVDYEGLVSAPEETLRSLFARIDLAWHPACLAFHAETGPAATASAAQVREPVHSRSVGLWRRHAQGLQRFADILRDQGTDPLTG